ncbi:cytosine permease [Gryllotalpicola sp.]|uniref:purine-cytosine permease family protein n=1 Tax=Gryllotalpicola sp. TaxID=1932787 RepID=UPI0026173C7C|nr:cytosine permease [Gryllotalpicola sp.]
MTIRSETPAVPARGLTIEQNALNTIDESERHGRPSSLFWPWFGANVSILGIAYGSYLLGFGVSFWQATIVGIVGIVVSFFFCGVIAIAGKRGSAPTMVLSRAAFGVNGNRLTSLLSWILTVGWETVLAAIAVLSTVQVFQLLGWAGPVTTDAASGATSAPGDVVVSVVALIVIVLAIIFAGVYGFTLIMRLQVWVTIITGVLTIVFFVLVIPKIDWNAVMAQPSGDAAAVIGGLVFMLTGFGLGWVNVAADYSRYLPRSSSGGAITGWTTFGASVAPAVLLVFGILLSGSSKDLNTAVSSYSVGGLATLVPSWFFIPFLIVALLGLIGGAALDIYSSGLALLSIGVKVPRYVAAGIDGLVMTLGAIVIVFVAPNFNTPFQGFLILTGVPVATWAGIMLADIALRKKAYSEKDLYDRKGRYGDVNWYSIALVVVGTGIGWGLIVNASSFLIWLGYLLEPFGLGGRSGAWSYANLGVLAALLIGFVGGLFRAASIRRQEADSAAGPAHSTSESVAD